MSVKKPYSPLPGHNYDDLVRETPPCNGVDPDVQMFGVKPDPTDEPVQNVTFGMSVWEGIADQFRKQASMIVTLSAKLRQAKAKLEEANSKLREWEKAERTEFAGFTVFQTLSGTWARVPAYALKKPAAKKTKKRGGK